MTDYSKQYLTFVALEPLRVSSDMPYLRYSCDYGKTWKRMASAIQVPTGGRILFKKDDGGDLGRFFVFGEFNIEGNIMSLLHGDAFIGKTDLLGNSFTYMFGGCPVVSAENLSLPAKTLGGFCYHSMFQGCTSLTTAPQLPATTLANYCYAHMFDNCTSLTTAPELPATTLSNGCYYGMFDNCTNLTEAPQLPATTLYERCYTYMFDNCTNLTEAPQLPATTLANRCYYRMFWGCAKLTKTKLLFIGQDEKENVYGMYYGCKKLKHNPIIIKE